MDRERGEGKRGREIEGKRGIGRRQERERERDRLV